MGLRCWMALMLATFRKLYSPQLEISWWHWLMSEIHEIRLRTFWWEFTFRSFWGLLMWYFAKRPIRIIPVGVIIGWWFLALFGVSAIGQWSASWEPPRDPKKWVNVSKNSGHIMVYDLMEIWYTMVYSLIFPHFCDRSLEVGQPVRWSAAMASPRQRIPQKQAVRETRGSADALTMSKSARRYLVPTKREHHGNTWLMYGYFMVNVWLYDG